MKKSNHGNFAREAAVLFCVLFALASPAGATTIYVHPGGAGDHLNIQDGINASSSGDTVLVADGDYRGTGNYDISFGGRNIVVRSENGPENCIVNLTSHADRRGFIFNNGEGPSAVLEGITIRGAWMAGGGSGGGIYVVNCSPTIRGNAIRRCSVQGSTTSPGWGVGGGVALYNSGTLFADNTVDSCSVHGYWTGGGGIYCSGGTPLITGNTISHNNSNGNYPYSDYGGGGICTRLSSPVISDNRIYQNTVRENHDGGGIFCYGNAAPDTVRIVNNVIRDNDGPRSASGGAGGGIGTYLSDVLVVNNVIQGNNENGLSGDNRVHVRNCIFDGNAGDEVVPGYVDVTYCWLLGQTYTGAGNINGSSITFVPGPLGDYYYDPLHECADAGNARASLICFDTEDGTVCMGDMSTQPDQGLDAGRVNMGVHYPRIPFTIYVPDHFATIQAAIDHAWPEDSVCVRAGAYPENINFLGKPIPVFSESGAAVTTIDGGGSGSVVTFNNGEGTGSELEGFTVTNGHAGNGGGIFCWSASPTIRDLIIEGNTADIDGGGMYVSSGSPEISGTVFSANTAQYGGGMRSSESDPVIHDCEFIDNVAYHGGGISAYNSNPHIDYTTFDGNHATGLSGGPGSGGGMYLSTGGALHNATIEYCVFADNEAQNAGGKGGGLLYGSNTYPAIDHCTFYWNMAELGAGIAASIGSATVDNTIVAFNRTGAGVACELSGVANMSCCDVYNNDGGDWIDCIAGQEILNHNFSSDPLFCDAYNGDYRVFSQSLCASPFNPSCGQVGAMGVGATPHVYNINADGTGDFPTIQDAVDAASGGQQIWLADGVYTGTGNRDVYYWNKSVKIRSASGSDACIVDCEGSSGDPHRGFLMTQREGDWAALEGITVRNAYSTGAAGGLYFSRSRGYVSGCVFENCYSTDGGGVFVSANADVNVDGCTFIGCSATNAGGGLRFSYAEGSVTDCVFLDNWAHWGGGGLYNYYAGADVSDCVFAGNVCDYWGGALHNDRAESSINVSDCTFSGNDAPQGGAIYNRRDAAITVDHTIIAFSTQGEAVTCITGASATLSCCDVYGNAGGDYTGCLSGQNGVNNNISENPGFCSAASYDFRLSTGSPCASANNPACGQIGSLGTGCGGARYVVRPDGTGDFSTIAEAVAACADGDTIDLADGTFTGDGNRDVSYGGRQIVLRSQSGDPTSCIIDCQGSDTDFHWGFAFNSGEGPQSVLENIQIINAYKFWMDDGAAVKCRASSPTILGCIFAYNTAGGGAAISCLDGAAPEISGCTFYRNSNLLAGDVAILTGSHAEIHNCTFFRAAPFAVSAAADCSADVYNTIISWTTAGSAVTCLDNGTISMSCCDLWANEGGDWTGCIAGQGSVDNNMTADPLFCDTTDVVLTVRTDSDCAAGNNIACGQVGAWGTACTPGTGVGDVDLPGQTCLRSCYPNPFNPSTTIAFELKESADVTLCVYDASGRLVRVLVDEGHSAGRYETTWDGRNQSGETVASGVYFYRLVAGSFVDSKKMVLLK